MRLKISLTLESPYFTAKSPTLSATKAGRPQNPINNNACIWHEPPNGKRHLRPSRRVKVVRRRALQNEKWSLIAPAQGVRWTTRLGGPGADGGPDTRTRNTRPTRTRTRPEIRLRNTNYQQLSTDIARPAPSDGYAAALVLKLLRCPVI